MPKVKRALISVFDKEGLVPFAKKLRKQGIEILSTGGTLKALKKAKVKVTSVSDVTGFPEILNGRVKTLNPLIHGGILYKRGKKEHSAQIKEHGIEGIDLVVVNLYPFTEVIKKKNVTLDEAIENIDIGGPTMLRAAAKNFEGVTVVCDPADYKRVADEITEKKGTVSKALSRELAVKVFAHTASYDAAIQTFLEPKKDELPEKITLSFEKKDALRYGENPHQQASFYRKAGDDIEIETLHGKALSYNNIMDLYASVEIINEFKNPAAAVIKHNNPCGVAENRVLAKAIERAIDSDPLSAFGGIVILNRGIGKDEAKVVLDKLGFFEVIIAPSFTTAAMRLLKKRKNLRIILTKDLQERVMNGKYAYRFVDGGLLLQEKDAPVSTYLKELKKSLKVVSKKKPTAKDINELLFAWACSKIVKSNSIVFTKNKATVGIGAGQMSRVDSMYIACRKAGERTNGAYAASDGFFPKADNIEVASAAGIKAIIQPGGSIRDGEVIKAVDEHDMIMVCTGKRHFRH